MSRIRVSIRSAFLTLLGLIGVGLLLEGLWFVWHGGPVKGIVLLLGAGVSLTGCGWWLLFRSPEGTLLPACKISPVTTVTGETLISPITENKNSRLETEMVSEFDVEGVHFQLLWKPGRAWVG